MKEALFRTAYRIASTAIYGNDTYSDWAYEKIQRFSTLFAVAANYASFTVRIPRIPRVFSVVVEPVFGCNLRCKTCHGVLHTPGHTRLPRMTWELYRRVVDQLPASVETITFGLSGEPLLHPELPDMVQYGASAGKRMIVFTNGTLLDGERRARLAAAPLHVLNVSVECDAETAREIRGTDQDAIRANVEEFAAIKRIETQIKLSVVMHEQSVGQTALLRRDWGRIATHIKISPCIRRQPEGPSRLCLEPWRGNLNILTDGRVTPCCADFDADLVIGSLATQSFAEIMRAEAYRTLLRSMLDGDIPKRCRVCAEFRDPRVPVRMRKKRQ